MSVCVSLKSEELQNHSHPPMKCIWVNDHCIIQSPLLSPEWIMYIMPPSGSPSEFLGISKQTWFGSHWNDTRHFHIREISAHCWAGRKRQCEICCCACGWACRTDPTLSHSHLNKLGHARCFQRVGFTIKVIYYHIFMPTRQEFTYTPRRQTTTCIHSDYVNKRTPLSPMFNQNVSLQSDSDSNSCSYSAVQDPSITSSFPLASDLNEMKNESEVTEYHTHCCYGNQEMTNLCKSTPKRSFH